MKSLSRRSLLNALIAAPLIAATRPAGPQKQSRLASDGRLVELWFWPALGKKRGRIHFSHGNFSAPLKYATLMDAWSRAGWDVLAPLHVDSSDHPEKARYSPMQSFALRLEDMEILAKDTKGKHYVAAGHSYGALIALILGGAKPLLPRAPDMQPRNSGVRSVLALSPPGPMPGLIDTTGFSALAVPAMVITGDKDIFPGQPADAWKQHLAAYDATASGGHRYALILDGVDHYFGGIIGRPEHPGPKQERAFALLNDALIWFLKSFGGGQATASQHGIKIPHIAAPDRLESR